MNFTNLKELYPVKDNFFQGYVNMRDVLRVTEGAPAADVDVEAASQMFNKEMVEAIVSADIGPQADVLDRVVVAAYRDANLNTPEKDLTRVIGSRSVKDFEFKTILYSDIENYAQLKIEEGYPATYIDVGQETNELEKFGRLVHVGFKAWRSDREGILAKLPERLGKSGKRTIMRQIAAMLGSAVNAATSTLWTTALGNRFALALTATNLETVLYQMSQLTETVSGEPRDTVMAYLVVPSAMQLTAERIVAPIRDTLALQTIAGNIVKYKLEVISNAMLDRYTTTGWWVFAAPDGDQSPIVDAYYEGAREPELFIKESDAVKIGGGGGREITNFDHETISWKGRILRKIYAIEDLYWMTGFSLPTT